MSIFYANRVVSGKPCPLVPRALEEGEQEVLTLDSACIPANVSLKEGTRVSLALKFNDEQTCICTLVVGRQDTVPLSVCLDEYAELSIIGPKNAEVHIAGHFSPLNDEEVDDDEGLAQLMGEQPVDEDEEDEDEEDEDDEDEDDEGEDDIEAAIMRVMNERGAAKQPKSKRGNVTITELNADGSDKAGAQNGSAPQLVPAAAPAKGKAAAKEEAARMAKLAQFTEQVNKGADAAAAEGQKPQKPEKAGKTKPESAQPNKKHASEVAKAAAAMDIEAAEEEDDDEYDDESVEDDEMDDEEGSDEELSGEDEDDDEDVEDDDEDDDEADAGIQEAPAVQPNGKKGKGQPVGSENKDLNAAPAPTVPASSKSKGKAAGSGTGKDAAGGKAGVDAGKGKAAGAQAGKHETEGKAGGKRALEEAGGKASGAPTKKRSRVFENGFEIHEVTTGADPSAPQAKPGKRLAVKYVGKLKSNGKVFDSTKGDKKFKFLLGVGEVIKGWDKGIVGMRVGDKRRFVVPPDLAYGATGVPGLIPKNATLDFDVELCAVK